MSRIKLITFLMFFSTIFSCKKEDNDDISGKSWQFVGTERFNNTILSICSDQNSNLYITGFRDENDKFYVKKWNGNNWNDLGGLRSNSPIYCLNSDPVGNIYASGHLSNDQETYNYIAKWDGNSWSDIGLHSDWSGETMFSCISPQGILYCTADNGPGSDVFMYSGGNSWINLESFNRNQSIETITADAFGKVYIGFLSSSLYPPVVAVYENGIWSELPAITNISNRPIRTSTTDQQGNYYVGGDLYDIVSSDSYVAKWDGNSWTRLGGLNGRVFGLHVDELGTLYATGSIKFNNQPFYELAKWDGSKWVNVGKLEAANLYSICSDPSGNLYVGGAFEAANQYAVKVYK